MSTLIEVNIDSWSAWSDDERLSSEIANTIQSTPLKLPQIAAMKKRRMSKLTKMAMQTAYSCLEMSSAPLSSPCCVFASQHGELHRTTKILQDLVLSEEVSPTDFSLSVHNSSVGLFSILTNNIYNTTSVAAGDDTFAYALLEASNILHKHPEQQVLVVFFDQELPSSLANFKKPQQITLSLALLLSSKSSNNLQFSMGNKSPQKIDEVNLALEFIKYLNSNQKELLVTGASMDWGFKKNA